MRVLLRTPSRDHRRAIVALARDPFIAQWTGPPGPNADLRALLLWDCRLPRVPVLAGFVHLDTVQVEGGFSGAFDIAIASPFRRRGLGLAAVRAAEQALVSAHDLKEMVLGVHVDNEPARALYRRAGYLEVQTIRAPDGREARLVRKRLTTSSQ